MSCASWPACSCPRCHERNVTQVSPPHRGVLPCPAALGCAHAPQCSLLSDVSMLQISVHGMHSAACSTAIKRALFLLPGVVSADVSLLTESATVEYETGPDSLISVDRIVQEVENCGFEGKVRNCFLHDGFAGKQRHNALYQSLSRPMAFETELHQNSVS
jgi:copper chaperone CopZ